jgi:large subunit ribosomal protein L28
MHSRNCALRQRRLVSLAVPADAFHGPLAARGGQGVCSGYTSPPMSKVCAICGKKPSFGHNRSHSMVATKRRFNPNLQRVRVLLDGKPGRAYVCTRCLKSGKVEKAI